MAVALHSSCMTVMISLSLSIQDGVSPLMIASFNGRVVVVNILLKAHADVHSQKKVQYWPTTSQAV